MSTSGISFSGLASGLDTTSIIQALLAVERRPIQQLETDKAELKKQKDLFGDLKGMLEGLAGKARDIRLSSTFVDFQASTDKEGYVTASASSSAAAGSYEIQVTSLAKAQVTQSSGYASADASIGAGGTILIDHDGTTYSASGSTLQELADSINSMVDGSGDEAPIRAQVIDTGNGADPVRLVITSEEPGTDNAFTITSADSGMDAFVADLNANTNAATQAQFSIDGIEIFRSSNQVSDVIDGVTLNLVGTAGTPAESTTRITVAADTEATSAKVKELVDQYNEIVDFLEGQSNVDSEGNAEGALFGDSTLRSVRSTLRSIMSSVVDTGEEAYQMLAQIGIKTDTQGRLTFTQSEFDEALTTDENAVKSVFTNTGSGIANRLYTELDLFTDSIDGLLKARTDGIDRISSRIDLSIDQAERRLEQYEQTLTQRFANLEITMSRLQSQGSSIQGIGG